MSGEEKKPKRRAASSLKIAPNVRCIRVYPTEGTSKTVAGLKTIGIKLTREQAVHLARVLLAASQDWETVDLTAYRLEKPRSDGTYRMTVTSSV